MNQNLVTNPSILKETTSPYAMDFSWTKRAASCPWYCHVVTLGVPLALVALTELIVEVTKLILKFLGIIPINIPEEPLPAGVDSHKAPTTESPLNKPKTERPASIELLKKRTRPALKSSKKPVRTTPPKKIVQTVRTPTSPTKKIDPVTPKPKIVATPLTPTKGINWEKVLVNGLLVAGAGLVAYTIFQKFFFPTETPSEQEIDSNPFCKLDEKDSINSTYNPYSTVQDGLAGPFEAIGNYTQKVVQDFLPQTDSLVETAQNFVEEAQDTTVEFFSRNVTHIGNWFSEKLAIGDGLNYCPDPSQFELNQLPIEAVSSNIPHLEEMGEFSNSTMFESELPEIYETEFNQSQNFSPNSETVNNQSGWPWAKTFFGLTGIGIVVWVVSRIQRQTHTRRQGYNSHQSHSLDVNEKEKHLGLSIPTQKVNFQGTHNILSDSQPFELNLSNASSSSAKTSNISGSVSDKQAFSNLEGYNSDFGVNETPSENSNKNGLDNTDSKEETSRPNVLNTTSNFTESSDVSYSYMNNDNLPQFDDDFIPDVSDNNMNKNFQQLGDFEFKKDLQKLGDLELKERDFYLNELELERTRYDIKLEKQKIKSEENERKRKKHDIELKEQELKLREKDLELKNANIQLSKYRVNKLKSELELTESKERAIVEKKRQENLKRFETTVSKLDKDAPPSEEENSQFVDELFSKFAQLSKDRKKEEKDRKSIEKFKKEYGVGAKAIIKVWKEDLEKSGHSLEFNNFKPSISSSNVNEVPTSDKIKQIQNTTITGYLLRNEKITLDTETKQNLTERGLDPDEVERKMQEKQNRNIQKREEKKENNAGMGDLEYDAFLMNNGGEITKNTSEVESKTNTSVNTQDENSKLSTPLDNSKQEKTSNDPSNYSKVEKGSPIQEENTSNTDTSNESEKEERPHQTETRYGSKLLRTPSLDKHHMGHTISSTNKQNKKNENTPRSVRKSQKEQTHPN